MLLGGVPLLGYFIYHRWRYGRTFVEVARRVGLQLGDPKYLIHSVAVAALSVFVLLILEPSPEPFAREGSAQSKFVGLGLGAPAFTMAFFYGVVQTGFTEELLFRGLIAGSLSRRLSVMWANLVQALIFLLPHLLILTVMPEMWLLLPLVFAGSLIFGWVRIRSASILGPWIMHATVNVTMALMVAAGTAA